MPQNLVNLTVEEVSLVDRPANAEIDSEGTKVPRARVALFKRDETSHDQNSETLPGDDTTKREERDQNKGVNVMTHEELVARVEKTEKENAARIEKLEGELAVQKTANQTLKTETEFAKKESALVIKMSDETRALYASMTDEVRKQFVSGDEKVQNDLIKAAKDAACKAAKKKPAHAEPDGDEDEDDIEMKKNQEELQKNQEDVQKKLTATEERLAKAESKLVEINKRERRLQFAEIAKSELPHVKGTDLEKGDLLMKMADAFGGTESADYKAQFAVLKSADAALKLQFSEVGKQGGGEGSAEAALFAKAEEISKSEKINIGKAMVKAAEQNPTLWADSERERRNAQRSA